MKNMRMLLKTLSKELPQHVGKWVAPTDQLVTLGKRLSMSANPTALPTVKEWSLQNTLLQKRSPNYTPTTGDLVRGSWNETQDR